MGYAKPNDKYFRGQKKGRSRNNSIPTFDRPSQARPSQVRTSVRAQSHGDILDENKDFIRALSAMSAADMRTFETATAGPNPTGCILAVRSGTASNRRPTSVVVPIGGGCGSFPQGGVIVGVTPLSTKVPSTPKPSATPKTEEVIGVIVRKPNGEIVLRFND